MLRAVPVAVAGIFSFERHADAIGNIDLSFA